MKILIGYDGSECATAALDDLSQAGLPDDCEALVVSVSEVWLPVPPSMYEIVEEAGTATSPAELHREFSKHSEGAKEARVLAEQARDRVQAKFPKWKVTADSFCGSPEWELLAQADEWKPDLIVVGSHGRTGLGRFILGSVSQGLLFEAKCSVRVSRGRVEEPNTPVRILVGVDGSPATDDVLKAVAERQWPTGSEVKIVLVNVPLASQFLGRLIPPLGEFMDEERREELDCVQKISGSLVEMLRSSSVKVTTEIRDGDPKRELTKVAQDWGADCIFVGSFGFNNRLERFVLGSVSAAVAARASCSVEVVRCKVQKGSSEP